MFLRSFMLVLSNDKAWKSAQVALRGENQRACAPSFDALSPICPVSAGLIGFVRVRERWREGFHSARELENPNISAHQSLQEGQDTQQWW